jgi:probable HAF family extracellular repeat protein
MFRKFFIAALCFAAGVAQAANSRWTITDLLPPWSGLAMAIDNRGEVTGWMRLNNGPFHHAFIWSNGELQDLGVPPGQYGSDASGMSNNGYIVGNAQDGQAMVWHNGDWTVLAQYGAFNDVSESGVVVGALRLPGHLDYTAVMYKDGVIADLGTIPGGNGYSNASAVNNAGAIVGYATLPTPPFSGLWKFRGFVYENGAMRDIGTLGGTSSFLYDVNNSGTAVGCSDLPGDRLVATVYSGGVLQQLADIPGNSCAKSVNDRGDVVGSSDAGGWLYSNGVLTMLAQIPEVRAAGYTNATPAGINDRGWIAGNGYKPGTGGVPFVLVPK